MEKSTEFPPGGMTRRDPLDAAVEGGEAVAPRERGNLVYELGDNWLSWGAAEQEQERTQRRRFVLVLRRHQGRGDACLLLKSRRGKGKERGGGIYVPPLNYAQHPLALIRPPSGYRPVLSVTVR